MTRLRDLESPALKLIADEWQASTYGDGTTDRESAMAEAIGCLVDMLQTSTAQLKALTSNDAVYDDVTGKTLSFDLLDLHTGATYKRAAAELAAVAQEHATLTSAYAAALLTLSRRDIDTTRAALAVFEQAHGMPPALVLR